MVGKHKMNFINALSYIFYVSKLFGLVPYQLLEYKRHKILKSSIIDNILSVLSLVAFVTSYHFTVAETYFDGKSFDSGKLSFMIKLRQTTRKKEKNKNIKKN